jgi:phage shock protein C
LQHEVKIPNSWSGKVAAFANSMVRKLRNILEFHHFFDWHASCSDNSRNFRQRSLNMEAQENHVALPLRSHTIFGVCEGIGEDFGFNPIFLRIPLATMVIVNPLIAIGGYFALGAAVLGSRLLFPERCIAQIETVAATPANQQNELAKAA